MKRFRSRYVRRVLVPVMAVSVLSACGGWKVQEMAPSQVVTEKEPGEVGLIMLDGDKVWLDVSHPLRGRYALKSYTVRVATDSVAYAATRSNNDELPKFSAIAALVTTWAYYIINPFMDIHPNFNPYGRCCR